jgi:hypothetical protein
MSVATGHFLNFMFDVAEKCRLLDAVGYDQSATFMLHRQTNDKRANLVF